MPVRTVGRDGVTLAASTPRTSSKGVHVSSSLALLRNRTAVVAAVAALVLATPGLSGSATAQQQPESCSPDPEVSTYVDREEISSAHLAAVDCVTQLGIARGLGNDQGEVYLPQADVRRDQMASFVAQTLTQAGVELPSGTAHGFDDVSDGNVHAGSIAQLAEAGIVNGVGVDRYAPSVTVRRDQMATFLMNALAYQAGVEPADLRGGDTPFEDVSGGNVHHGSIQGAYNVGITTGTAADSYTPAREVTREAMASFLVRSLDAMQSRQTVSDRDGGALAHTVYTFPSESGRCFQVKAGDAWVAGCDPETDETLQLRTVAVADDFTVAAGLATADVDRVVVEFDGTESVDLDLVDIGSESLRAWASPILAEYIDVIVAYDGDQEVARTAPDDATSPPFPADTAPDEGEGDGAPVTVTDISFGHHQTYDRAVFEVAAGGHAGWHAEYVEEAIDQNSGQTIDLAGDATLEFNLTNIAYPTETDLDTYDPETRLAGVDAIRELYVGTTFEGISQIFVGLDAETPFRVFSLEDPERVVLDLVHPTS